MSGLGDVEYRTTNLAGEVDPWRPLPTERGCYLSFPTLPSGPDRFKIAKIEFRMKPRFESGWYSTTDGVVYCARVLREADGSERAGLGPDPGDILLKVTLPDGTPYRPDWVVE